MKNLQSFAEIFATWTANHPKKVKKKPVNPNDLMEKWLEKNEIVKKDDINDIQSKKINWKSAKVDLKLDLHGMTWSEAESAIGSFIERAQKNGKRKILIIHGKGIHSSGGQSVLKKNVRSLLERDSRVGEFHECDAKDGGNGATWAVLK